MSEDNSTSISLFGGFWTAGWLFSWGFLGLTGWKVVWAIFIWAYYLGSKLGGFA